MIKRLHSKKFQKWVWIAISIFVLPGFLFWGFSSFLEKRKQTHYTMKLFGKTVPEEDFEKALSAVKNQLVLMYGNRLVELPKYLNLEQEVVTRLILLSEAKKRKLKASDNEVITMIMRIPFFYRKGRFDNNEYSYQLNYVLHTAPRAFEEQIRENLLIKRLFDEVTAPVKITDEEIKVEYTKENEQISVSYMVSAPAVFLKDIPVTEEETQGYFKEHSLDFKQPLSYNLEYVACETQEEADGVAKRLLKKEALSKAVKELNLTLKETGLFSQLDPIPGIGWSPAILKAISTLKAGEISKPLQSDKKIYFISLKELKEPYVPEFQIVKEKVKSVILRNKSQAIAKEKIESCLKDLQGSASLKSAPVDFDTLAKKYGIKAAQTDLIKTGSYLEGIGSSDTILEAARNLKEGAVSPVITMPSGFYIIKVKSRIPIDEAKFQLEKEEFKDTLLQRKREEFFGRFQNDLLKKAHI